jgi:hypothetical protein
MSRGFTFIHMYRHSVGIARGHVVPHSDIYPYSNCALASSNAGKISFSRSLEESIAGRPRAPEHTDRFGRHDESI